MKIFRNEISIYTVDAFTSAPFTGNPAAVCLLEDDISDNLKQKIAAEMNISETAFVTKAKGSDFSSDSNFSLRWFTPSTEVGYFGQIFVKTHFVLLGMFFFSKLTKDKIKYQLNP